MNVRSTCRPHVAIRECSAPFGPRSSRELLELRARIQYPKWVNRENTARQSANERAFPFLRINERPPKPRTRGITEIRGPYYTPLGPRQLEDVLLFVDHSQIVQLESLRSDIWGTKSLRGRVVTYKG
jgi:hypothetical protein